MTKVQERTAKFLKEKYQIEEKVTALMFEEKILHEPDCRNVLIREEYFKGAEPKEKMRLKGKIADRYCVSVKLVEKILSE
jgi:hypothetical protein